MYSYEQTHTYTKTYKCSYEQNKSEKSLTTAGEGTWMLGMDRGRTWLARWHNTTPSVKAAPRSLGKDTLSRHSIFYMREAKRDLQFLFVIFLFELYMRNRTAQ